MFKSLLGLFNTKKTNSKPSSLIKPVDIADQIYTLERAKKFLVKSDFPQVFSDLFNGNEIPKNFDISFGIPGELYLCNRDEQLMIVPEPYEPLWDNGNFDSIVCVKPGSREIIELYVEGGETVFRNYSHYLAEKFRFFWECEIDDELLIEYARHLGFKYLDQVNEFLVKNNPSLPYEEYEKKFDELARALD